jgi:predicted Zn-dependent protease
MISCLGFRAGPRPCPGWFIVVLALVMLGTLPSVLQAAARSPLAEEVRTFATRYHERLTRIDTIREELERATKADADADAENLLALAQVSFIWGDVRATTGAQRLAAYEQGRQAAKRAMELEPKSAAAHFWYATNTARYGQTKGVVQSLFLLSAVQEEIGIIFNLDPKFTPAYALAGNVLYEVPRFLGGDVSKAEEMFRNGLQHDSKFTGMRIGLAKTLIEQGRTQEARRELQAVLEEKEPRNLAEWVMKDVRQARQLLNGIP